MTEWVATRATQSASLAAHVVGALLLLGLAVASAGAIAIMGFWALLLPFYVTAAVAAVVRPKETALVALAMAIVFEGGAIDFTAPVSQAMYLLPPGWEDALGVTTSPLEVVTLLIAGSLAVRAIASGQRLPRLPLVAWAVPVTLLLGLLYGLQKGGPSNLAYTEMRGLIAGIAVFTIAARLAPGNIATIARVTLSATLTLAVILLLRYFFYVKTGAVRVPAELQFAHENSILLGFGMLIGAGMMLEAKELKTILGSALYCAVILIAMIATGRRAATLVLLIGGLSVGGLLLPRRPVLVAVVGIPLMIGSGVYLGAYWNREYGALAQPARAIRSEFDPTLRDQSSDTYRTIEKQNVIETIRLNRIFGVGFGRPFIQFQPLPYLGSFWPLQSYTPHQSVLWLWLKMGWFGISVFLGFWVVVVKRCLERMRSRGITSSEWTTAAVLFSASAAYLAYATVDLAMASGRQLGPIAIVAAIALTLPRDSDRQRNAR